MNSGGTWKAAGMPIDLNSGPQIISHDIVEDQHEGVADQELHQHVGAVDAAHEDALENQAEQIAVPSARRTASPAQSCRSA